MNLRRSVWCTLSGYALFTVLTAWGASGCRSKKLPPERAAVDIDPARAAWVTNNGSDSLSVLDLDDGRVVTVSLDLDGDAHEAPHHVAASRDMLYVALAYPDPRKKQARDPHAQHARGERRGELLALDMRTASVRARLEVDENPGDVLLAGDRVLVTHFDLRRAFAAAERRAPPAAYQASLHVFDVGQGLPRPWAARPLCVAPHGMAVTADASTALIACYGSDELAVVDLRTPELATTRVPLGVDPGVLGTPRFGPYSVVLAPDGQHALVAELEGREVRWFDLAARRFMPEHTVALGARAMIPCFVSATEAIVPLAVPDGVARVDMQTAHIRQRVMLDDACVSPHVAACRADGRILLVCEGDHVGNGAVLELDAQALTPIRRWEVGVFPDGIAFAAP